MKIASLYVSNFLGATAVEVATDQPVQLFAGRNGAGKSSLRDAIALALTGDLGRVVLKKEAAQLIHVGATAAVCEVRDADGDVHSVTLTGAGKMSDTRGGRTVDPVLPYVLDAQRFARLEPNDRRAFLFGLMDLKTDGKAIVDRLLKRGIEKARVDRVAPLLRAGFETACKEAKAKATEAKGAWRAVTGETYGSEKAKTWRAAVPPYDASAAKAVATELQHCDVAIEQWQQQIGKLQAQETHRAALRGKLPALQEQALRADRIRTKLEADEQTLAEVEQRVKTTSAAAGGAPRVGLVHELGWAVNNLIMFGEPLDPKVPDDARVLAALTAYEAEFGKVAGAQAGGDSEARSRLPELQKARDTAAAAVANDKRDLEAAQRAKVEADAIAAELAEPFDAAGLSDAHEQADKLKAQRVEVVKKLDTLKSIKAQIDAAEKKTTDAAAHAADVTAWDQLADALAPDGIPGEILSEALGPMNERLQQAAADTGWARPEIDSGMEISVAGQRSTDRRSYRLLSESERWRTDAMLAEAIAHLSGARLLVLDRFDVLDLNGRQDLLSWLDTLAETGEIDTAFLFGTLKAAPANLPATMAAHWIENGVVGQLKEAA